MNKSAGYVAGLTLATLVSGCCTPPAKPPETARVHEVINGVKEQLLPLYTAPLVLEQAAQPGAVCKSAGGTNLVVVKPDLVKLTLKTVATSEYNSSLGLAAPLGVVKVDPSYGGAYSRGHTQALEITFDVVDLEKTAKAQKPSGDIDSRQLRDLLTRTAQELLLIDHARLPCVKPTYVKSFVNFDVVSKKTGGIGIEIVGLKVGNKMIATDEFHQVLEIDFTLEGSSLMPR